MQFMVMSALDNNELTSTVCVQRRCTRCAAMQTNEPLMLQAVAYACSYSTGEQQCNQCKLYLHADAARAAVGMDIADWQAMPSDHARAQHLAARQGLRFRALVFAAAVDSNDASPGWACSSLAVDSTG